MLQMCDTKNLMKQGLLSTDFGAMRKLDKPCKTMTGINVEPVETTWGTNLEGDHIGKFLFFVTFQQPTFIEIEQIR